MLLFFAHSRLHSTWPTTDSCWSKTRRGREGDWEEERGREEEEMGKEMGSQIEREEEENSETDDYYLTRCDIIH